MLRPLPRYLGLLYIDIKYRMGFSRDDEELGLHVVPFVSISSTSKN
jgi:hypothetical protein